MLTTTIFSLSLLGLVRSNPVALSDQDPSPTETESTTTSGQWIIIDGTSVFWPTSTDYFYGPTEGPKASAVSCNAEWIQYNERSWGLYDLGYTSSAEYTTSQGLPNGACWSTVRPEIFDDPHTGPLTTLCDNIPRALGPRETITAWYPGTGPCYTTWDTYSGTTNFYRTQESAEPSCSLNTEACIPIWSTYNSLSSSYFSAHPTPTEGDTASPLRPSSCPSPVIYDPCTACHLNVETATVYYWPVTTADGDFCKQNGTTLPPNGPSTVVLDGKTLESPTIYISFPQLSAWGNNRLKPASQCGDTHTSKMVEVMPENVSSVRSHRGGRYHKEGTAMPFNFADYQPHIVGTHTMPLIPWNAYQGGGHCPTQGSTNLCTMIRDDYYPWLSLPQEVRQIDPKWTGCDLLWNIPSATLVPLGDQIPTPTQTKADHVQNQPATPHSAVEPPTPTPTGGNDS